MTNERMETRSRPVIVSSRADPASINIAENLIRRFHFSTDDLAKASSVTYSRENVTLVEIDELGIYACPQQVPEQATSIIFVSKHVSSSGKPALTVHTTGNPTREALYGGEPEQLSFVDPAMIKKALRSLREQTIDRGLDTEVTMEATHHGPTRFQVSVMFVEVGQWTRRMVGSCSGRSGRKSHDDCSGRDSVTEIQCCRFRRHSLLSQAHPNLSR